jgi:predicted DNA-binding transcriptional regulator AlpA
MKKRTEKCAGDQWLVLIDIQAVAGMLGVSRATIDRQCALGLFPEPVRIGRCRRWRLADINVWLESQ